VAEELTLKANEIARKKSDFLEGTYLLSANLFKTILYFQTKNFSKKEGFLKLMSKLYKGIAFQFYANLRKWEDVFFSYLFATNIRNGVKSLFLIVNHTIRQE